MFGNVEGASLEPLVERSPSVSALKRSPQPLPPFPERSALVAILLGELVVPKETSRVFRQRLLRSEKKAAAELSNASAAGRLISKGVSVEGLPDPASGPRCRPQ